MHFKLRMKEWLSCKVRHNLDPEMSHSKQDYKNAISKVKAHTQKTSPSGTVTLEEHYLLKVV